MNTRWLAFGLLWAVTVSAGLASTARLKDNAREYLALRDTLKAIQDVVQWRQCFKRDLAILPHVQ